MLISEIVVTDPVGLHARPAALFVKLANRFSSKISVKNLTTESEWANAKSILSLLTAGVSQGERIAIRAEGDDEATAIEALIKLVHENFPANE